MAKGIRMFARMAVPCVAVAENMSFFDTDDGKRFAPNPTDLPNNTCKHAAGLQVPLKEITPLAGSGASMHPVERLCMCIFVFPS